MFIAFFYVLFFTESGDLIVLDNLKQSQDLILLDAVEERVLWGRNQGAELAVRRVEKRLKKKAKEIGGTYLHISFIQSRVSHAEGRAWVFADALNRDNARFLAEKHLGELNLEILDLASFYQSGDELLISVRTVGKEQNIQLIKLVLDASSSKLKRIAKTD